MQTGRVQSVAIMRVQIIHVISRIHRHLWCVRMGIPMIPLCNRRWIFTELRHANGVVRRGKIAGAAHLIVQRGRPTATYVVKLHIRVIFVTKY